MAIEKKIVVVGPCSAEDCKQVRDTFRAILSMLANQPFVMLFRAGIWKPRSLPSTFQGVGEVGLQWLSDIEKEFSVPCLTEVISTEQLQKVLEAGLAGIWLGARTTANPVLVQSLADTLAQYENDLPKYILIKNPISEDAMLWLGAVERIEKAIEQHNFAHKSNDNHGVKAKSDHVYEYTDKPQIFLVHRGCNHRPCLEMAYRLHRLRPQYPLLLDASHMSGNAAQVRDLCLLGQHLDYDGWMIEVHNTPKEALSDAQQQVSPQIMNDILQTLLQSPAGSDDDLVWLRSILTEVDDDFFLYLKNRLRIVHQIGEYKQQRGLEAFQPQQYEKMRERFEQKATEMGVPTEFLRTIYQNIHDLSVMMQNKTKL